MPCFMVIDGIKSLMDDDLFDRLSSEVSDEQQEPITPIHTRLMKTEPITVSH